jgi:hypothetical protein
MESVVYEAGTVRLVKKLKKFLKKTKTLDLFNEFHRSTVNAIFELFFENRFYMIENSWFPLITSFHYTFQFLAVQTVLAFIGILSKILIIIFINIIYAVWCINSPKKDGKSVLSQFFAATDPDTVKKLTDADALTKFLITSVARIYASAVSLSWIFWVIGMHPEIYRLIQEEVDTVFPYMDTPLCAETCRTMLPITRAVILESMRLYPASGECLQWTIPKAGARLGGYNIPGDVSYQNIISIYYHLIISI